MRAMAFKGYRRPVEPIEVPAPTPGKGQLLIRVAATSVNPIDWKINDGVLWPFAPRSFPAVPGFDVSGVVADVGPGVNGWRVGQRVHARMRDPGGAAEFAVADADVCVEPPASMTDITAAGLPLAGMTALQGLRDALGLSTVKAERVLVVGASGGVGHLAVQIAKAEGHHVTGVCSARNAEKVRELGADAVVDYAAPNAWEGVAPFDAIFDAVGGAVLSWGAKLTPNGRFGSALPGPTVLLRSVANAFTRQSFRPILLKTNGPDLAALDALCEAGKLTVLIDAVYPLSGLDSAWARSRSGRAVGKIVLTP
jgi:NADPH:quinone reductase-like Zn-dependent oxidoreductase